LGIYKGSPSRCSNLVGFPSERGLDECRGSSVDIVSSSKLTVLVPTLKFEREGAVLKEEEEQFLIERIYL